MKITLYSDLHLEFGSFEPSEGEVCVLAGDICLAEDITNPVYLKFFRQVSERFDKVFYVLGNHEHYYWDFNLTEGSIRRHLPQNITLLQNEFELYEGVHFIGATMWTDFHNANQAEMLDAQLAMSDYKIIHDGEELLAPHTTLQSHDDTIHWFNQVLPTLRGKKVIVT